jgi:hypothetical protein
MKKLTLILLALALSTGLAFAAEKRESKESKKKAVGGKKYEVVDGCYIQKGEHGPKHKDCAKKCIGGGGELALLRGGDLFVPVDKDFKSARNKFTSKAGEEVEVKGKTISKGGVNYLQISE